MRKNSLYVTKACPDPRRAESRSSLIKNPPSGGIPLLENLSSPKSLASTGSRCRSVAKALRDVWFRPLVSSRNHLRKEEII